MMLGIVALNGEKMPPIWFKTGYRLTGADYRDILPTKVLLWVRKITKKGDYVFQQDGAQPTQPRLCKSGWGQT
jgi:hypothetical protein